MLIKLTIWLSSHATLPKDTGPLCQQQYLLMAFLGALTYGFYSAVSPAINPKTASGELLSSRSRFLILLLGGACSHLIFQFFGVVLLLLTQSLIAMDNNGDFVVVWVVKVVPHRNVL